MADATYIGNLLRGADPSGLITRAFRAVLEGGLRFGRATHLAQSKNHGLVFLAGTTAAIADDEFIIVHGLGKTPYVLLPVLPLDTVGGALVPLTVTRAADAERIYLSSSVTSAAVTVAVEV